jgi:hypothetical protein
MGANATTSVPVYASGEVLTAANLNITNSGIPVFADSTARTAAFGGTGEKVLAEGQYAYLESDNSTSFWDGAAWQSVGVTPGLVRVGGGTLSGSTTTFSNVFSATYDNYLVLCSNWGTAAEWDFYLDGQTSGYTYGTTFLTTSSTGFQSGSASASAIRVIGGVTAGTLCSILLGNPFASARKYFQYYNVTTALYNGFATNSSTTSRTGLVFAGSSMSGTVDIYGYSKA